MRPLVPQADLLTIRMKLRVRMLRSDSIVRSCERVATAHTNRNRREYVRPHVRIGARTVWCTCREYPEFETYVSGEHAFECVVIPVRVAGLTGGVIKIFLEGQAAFSRTRQSNNRSVMPLDVLGRTRATLKESACSPWPRGPGNPLKLLRAGDWGRSRVRLEPTRANPIFYRDPEIPPTRSNSISLSGTERWQGVPL
ncbi:hypothetical protein EVAR_27696_1 [Eumeta japonica]|uniref:Uncharacterized protein n=1 Tax=Eumeta variegata TaxID=151549 RepID=A0A4C1WRL3_EUMVA|nr:hypothetical protein EVAR_27696_1 [Eumeta japonica]